MSGTEQDLQGNELLIGRDPGADLVLDDPSVSSQHAKMNRQDGTWHIKDLGSSNGCQVNGQDIINIPLRHGDSVMLGDTTFIFRSEEGAPETPEEPFLNIPEPEPAAEASPDIEGAGGVVIEEKQGFCALDY